MHASLHHLVCAVAFAGGAIALLAPISLRARTQIPAAAQPQLAASADGRVWLVYGQTGAAPAAAEHSPPSHQGGGAGHDGHSGHAAHAKGKGHGGPRPDGDICVTLSTDGGATFAPAVKAATVPSLMLGMRRGPRIAAHGDTLTITVVGAELMAFRSIDAGRTWIGPVTINDVSKSAREGLHDLAVSPNGTLFATWLDLRNGKMELWCAESRDAGQTWSTNEQVYRSPDKSICECCHPTALFDEEGNLAVMWRNSIEGSRDMWMTTRPKGAAKFSAAQKLGEGTWKINGCPMDGGEIVALGGGNFGAVWQRNGEVFISRGEGAEMNLGKGKQPVAIHTGNRPPLVIWQLGADLMALHNPHGSDPVKHASDAAVRNARGAARRQRGRARLRARCRERPNCRERRTALGDLLVFVRRRLLRLLLLGRRRLLLPTHRLVRASFCCAIARSLIA